MSVRREPNGRSLTPSRLLCRVDKGCSSSSPSTSPRVTNFDQGEWGSRRAQRAQEPGEPQMPDFTVCSYGPVRAPAERPPCPDSIPPLKRPLRPLQTLSRPILCAPDQAPFVSAGLLNFHGTALELYLELAPHPGGLSTPRGLSRGVRGFVRFGRFACPFCVCSAHRTLWTVPLGTLDASVCTCRCHVK